MRRPAQPVEVTAVDGRPTTLRLGGEPRPIRAVTDAWIETGRWWDAEPRKQFYRVDAGGLFDLSVDETGAWRVEVVWD